MTVTQKHAPIDIAKIASSISLERWNRAIATGDFDTTELRRINRYLEICSESRMRDFFARHKSTSQMIAGIKAEILRAKP